MRNTAVSLQLPQLLMQTSHPISVPELLKSLSVNKTTIYRQLEKLITNKQVVEVDLGDGKKRYELNSAQVHHHHFICNKCKKIECFDLSENMEAQEKKLNRQLGVQVTSHRLDFYGLCQKCQT